jgi:hypothetical protein
VVFELSPPRTKGGKWMEAVLHNFAGGSDGETPNGGLVLNTTGAVYGTTPTGGNQLCNFGNGNVGCGIVFELTRPGKKDGAWIEKILHRFTKGNDGAGPNGGLILDAKGSLYGTAGDGGSGEGLGVVFGLTQSQNGKWGERTLYSFQGGSDGRNPAAPLSSDSYGKLYGTTSWGGTDLGGTLFRLDLRAGTWDFHILYSFSRSPNAEFPTYRLVFDGAGNLYGATQNGGTGQACQGGCGTVFEVKP